MTIRSPAGTRRRFPSASPPTVAKRPALSDQPRKRFIQLYNRLLARGHTSWKVFGDFCEMAAMSLANGIVRCDERESKYMAVVRRYTHPELDALCEMLGCVVLALDHEVEGQLREHGKPAFPRCDFLGSLFMELGLASHWKKQFFTPYALCEGIARMTFSPEGLRETIEEHGFVTVAEPACGAGALVIAFASAMLQEGLNPQQQLHVTAIDLDQTAAYMAFIQLSILGIPATVYVGNSLSGRMHEVLHTPFYHRGLWEWKLRRRHLRRVAEHASSADCGDPAAFVEAPTEPTVLSLELETPPDPTAARRPASSSVRRTLPPASAPHADVTLPPAVQTDLFSAAA